MRCVFWFSFCAFTLQLRAQTTVTGPLGEQFSMRVVARNLGDPWEVTYGPDNFLWITEAKAYKVSRLDPATGAKTVLLDLGGERQFPRYDKLQKETGGKPWPQGGLMGLALHPQLLRGKPYVYLAYHCKFAGAADAGRGCAVNFGGCFFTVRLVRYRYDRLSQKLVQPVVLCDTIPASSDHNGGRMLIAPLNGRPYLFYAVGDMGAGQFDNAARPNHAQQTESYEGKILRFNTEPDSDADSIDRWIPNDNPFGTMKQSAVYSYGHRNPQGLAYAVIGGSGRLYEGEHGPFSDDEINILEGGKNYGHPLVLGFADGNYDGLAASVTPYREVPGRWHTAYPLIGSERDNARAMGADYRDPIKTLYPNNHDFLVTLYEQISSGAPRPQWPSEATSGLDIYTSTAIPGWQNSLLLPSLKRGHLVRIRLNATGDGTAGDTLTYFKAGVRYRDLAISSDGRKIYLAADSAAVSSGPSRSDPKQLALAGCIIEYSYRGMNSKGEALGKRTRRIR